jgi:hypothetical protein
MLACQGQLRLASSGHVTGIDMDAALKIGAARGSDLVTLSELLPAAEAGLVEAIRAEVYKAAPMSPRSCTAVIAKCGASFPACEGFRMPAGRDVAGSAGGRRPKASREGTRGGPGSILGLWGFDGCRRSGAAQGTGLMEARDGLVGRELATGVAQRVVSGAQARWCRCDRRPGS